MRIFSTLFHNKNFQSIYGNLLVACLGLLNFSLLARSFTKEEFGQWVIFISGSTMLEMVRAGIVQTPLIKYISGIETEQRENKVLSSGFFLGLIISLSVSFIVFAGKFILVNQFPKSGFELFFAWFPLLFLASFPRNFYIWKAQGKRDFIGIFKSQFLTFSLFTGYVISHYLNNFPLNYLPIAYIICQGLNSFWLLISSKCFNIKFPNISKIQCQSILRFGKFSMGTMIGGNLLKTVDTLIIGLVLNASSVAIFSIALRLTEVFDLLIRSLANNLFPQLSAAANQENNDSFHFTFKRYTVGVTLLFLLLMIFSFSFAEILIVMIAGPGYTEAVLVFRILICGCLFIPFYRFSGVALDAINRPDYNFYRISLLLTINVIGDFLVIYYFGTLWSVALLTAMIFCLGTVSGRILIKRAGLKISIRELIGYPLSYLLKPGKLS